MPLLATLAARLDQLWLDTPGEVRHSSFLCFFTDFVNLFFTSLPLFLYSFRFSHFL